MKNAYIFLIILLSLLNQIISVTKCNTNLECLETGCCDNNICQKASKCNRINKISYGLIGGVGFILIVLNFLYFFYKIKKTRKVVLELKKLDDKIYNKRKSSNLDFLKKLKENKI